jgi:hypothetical protein
MDGEKITENRCMYCYKFCKKGHAICKSCSDEDMNKQIADLEAGWL